MACCDARALQPPPVPMRGPPAPGSAPRAAASRSAASSSPLFCAAATIHAPQPPAPLLGWPVYTPFQTKGKQRPPSTLRFWKFRGKTEGVFGFGAPFLPFYFSECPCLSLSTESWSGAKSEEKSRKPAKLPGICQVYRAFSGMPYARKLPRYLPVGLCALFSNIFENIEGPAHFHIREYSREHRCPGRLFPQELYELSSAALDLSRPQSKDILEYS